MVGWLGEECVWRFTPRKLTCPLKINGWKMYFLSRWGYVSFQGCIPKYSNDEEGAKELLLATARYQNDMTIPKQMNIQLLCFIKCFFDLLDILQTFKATFNNYIYKSSREGRSLLSFSDLQSTIRCNLQTSR